MAITGLNCCITGALESKFFFKNFYQTNKTVGQSVFCHMSSWYSSGSPSPFITDYNSDYIFNTTTGGILPFCGLPFDQPEPNKKLYLGYINIINENDGVIQTAAVFDRIWQSSGIALTGQNINIITPSLPARDEFNTNSGHGYMISLELTEDSPALPAINKTDSGPRFIYTNSFGQSSRTGYFTTSQVSNIQSNNMIKGMTFVGKLWPGDIGVRSVELYSNTGGFGATFTGTGVLVISRYIDTIDDANRGTSATTPRSAPTIIGGKREMFSGSTPYFIVQGFGAFQSGRVLGNISYIST
jgi:hypothetical protein